MSSPPIVDVFVLAENRLLREALLAIYSTFEQMHGRKSSISELIERLRPFSRDSVLTLCAFISILEWRAQLDEL